MHLDGARLWNAAAALDLPFRAFTTDAGVDVLSLGGTKNGLLGAEAVVVLDPDSAGRSAATGGPGGADGLVYLRKLTMQLASKMRFTSAQLLSLFDDELGLRSARHANAMTQRLRAALEAESLPGLAFSLPSPANAIFATLPNDVADRIRERVRFYDWDRARGEVRWMTAWDTTPEDVDHFVAAIGEELRAVTGTSGT